MQMIGMDFLLKHALDTDDKEWMNILLFCDHTTHVSIEKTLSATDSLNTELIDRMFEAHRWLAVNKPCEANEQEAALLSVCIKDRADLVQRMLKDFRNLSPAYVATLLGIARHHRQTEIESMLKTYCESDKTLTSNSPRNNQSISDPALLTWPW